MLLTRQQKCQLLRHLRRRHQWSNSAGAWRPCYDPALPGSREVIDGVRCRFVNSKNSNSDDGRTHAPEFVGLPGDTRY